MKALRFPSNKNQSDYMRQRREENLERCVRSGAESLVWERLNVSEWQRQFPWGYRIFDFWNRKLGCALEVDGLEHNRSYDVYRDEYNFRRSAIVVLRIRNYNEEDLKFCLSVIRRLNTWKARRVELGIKGQPGETHRSKKAKRWLSDQPYEGSMLRDYLKKFGWLTYSLLAQQCASPVGSQYTFTEKQRTAEVKEIAT